MSGRALMILLLITLALAVLIHVGQLIDREPQTEENRLLQFSRADIETLQIVRSDETVRVVRKGGGWEIVSPLYDLADHAAIDELLSGLEEISAQRSFDAEGDLSNYGLDPPALEITLAGDVLLHAVLRIGRTNPAGDSRYAQTEDRASILLIGGSVFRTVDKGLGQLRSRQLLCMERSDVSLVEHQTGNDTIRFVRSENDWWLTAPLHARADAQKMSALLRKFQEPVVTGFSSGEMESAGGSQETSWIFRRSSTDSGETLWVREQDPAHVVARSSVRDFAMAIDHDLFSLPPRGIDVWRDRHLFPFDSYSVDRVSAMKPGKGHVDFVRRDGAWFVGSEKAASAKVIDLIQRVEDCQVETFLPDTSEARWSRELLLTLWTADGDSIMLEIGPARNGLRPMVADHLGGEVLVRCFDPDSVSVQSSAWRDHRLVTFFSYDITAVTLQTTTRKVRATRRGFDQWKTPRSWPLGLSADEFLDQLQKVTIARFPEEIGDERLPPELATVVLEREGEPEIRIQLYGAVAESLHASVGRGGVCALEPATCDLMGGLLEDE